MIEGGGCRGAGGGRVSRAAARRRGPAGGPGTRRAVGGSQAGPRRRAHPLPACPPARPRPAPAGLPRALPVARPRAAPDPAAERCARGGGGAVGSSGACWRAGGLAWSEAGLASSDRSLKRRGRTGAPARPQASCTTPRYPLLASKSSFRCLVTHPLPAGFLYDSSIPEPFPTATSPDGNTRLWPYSMDYGLPQVGRWFRPHLSRSCPPARLSACPPACPSARPPACLPACLPSARQRWACRTAWRRRPPPCRQPSPHLDRDSAATWARVRRRAWGAGGLACLMKRGAAGRARRPLRRTRRPPEPARTEQRACPPARPPAWPLKARPRRRRRHPPAPARPLLRQRDAARAVGVPDVGRAGRQRRGADQHGPPGGLPSMSAPSN